MFKIEMASEAQPEQITSDLFDQLEALIEKRALMCFKSERRNHLINTVVAHARKIGEETHAYIRRILSPESDAELMALIDSLTINETSFFRYVPQLELLTNIALPEIIARKRAAGAPKRIDIWSAACSTGQEVYTLAVLAYEAVRFLPQWDVRIYGTDISPTVLEIARRGVYADTRLEMMPPIIRTRYFEQVGHQIRVKDVLRRVTYFQQHNLRDQFPLANFDIIFCRNVLIYFSREEQARLARRFNERISPGGFLFLGHSESLQGLDVDFCVRIHERGVSYQKGGV